jgi:hypothetical protein
MMLEGDRGSVKQREGTAGIPYTSLHSLGFNAAFSIWQKQVLLFGTFWDFFLIFSI